MFLFQILFTEIECVLSFNNRHVLKTINNVNVKNIRHTYL